MYYINLYDPVDRGRSSMINHGQYQKQSPGKLNFNNNPPKLQKPHPKDAIQLSKENKKKADHLTKETLKKLKLKTDEKKEAKKPKTGLDYYI
jgi:hypothetical protein